MCESSQDRSEEKRDINRILCQWLKISNSEKRNNANRERNKREEAAFLYSFCFPYSFSRRSLTAIYLFYDSTNSGFPRPFPPWRNELYAFYYRVRIHYVSDSSSHRIIA